MNRRSIWFRGVAPIARLSRVTNGRNLTLGEARRRRVKYLKVYLHTVCSEHGFFVFSSASSREKHPSAANKNREKMPFPGNRTTAPVCITKINKGVTVYSNINSMNLSLVLPDFPRETNIILFSYFYCVGVFGWLRWLLGCVLASETGVAGSSPDPTISIISFSIIRL